MKTRLKYKRVRVVDWNWIPPYSFEYKLSCGHVVTRCGKETSTMTKAEPHASVYCFDCPIKAKAMTSHDEAMRAEFEKWALSKGFRVGKMANEYLSNQVVSMWEAWRTAVAKVASGEIMISDEDAEAIIEAVYGGEFNSDYSRTKEVREALSLRLNAAARAQAASGEVNQDQPNGYTIDEFISGVWSYSYTSETGQEMSGCAHWASYNLACIDAWGAYAESLEAKLKVQAASGDPVGPRHPEVIRWRNDAIESCAAIAERYREVGNCDEWVVVNIRALLTQPPAPSVSVEALEKLYRAYVRLLEAGRDRIVDLGGTCDSVDVMEHSDPELIEARTLIAASKKV